MKVRCIEFGLLRLTQGKDYEVLTETPRFYKVINDKGFPEPYMKNRFEVVPEPKEKENTVKITLSKPEVKYNPGDVYKCRSKLNGVIQYLLAVKNVKLANCVNTDYPIKFINLTTGNPADIIPIIEKYELTPVGQLNFEE